MRSLSESSSKVCEKTKIIMANFSMPSDGQYQMRYCQLLFQKPRERDNLAAYKREKERKSRTMRFGLVSVVFLSMGDQSSGTNDIIRSIGKFEIEIQFLTYKDENDKMMGSQQPRSWSSL